MRTVIVLRGWESWLMSIRIGVHNPLKYTHSVSILHPQCAPTMWAATMWAPTMCTHNVSSHNVHPLQWTHNPVQRTQCTGSPVAPSWNPLNNLHFPFTTGGSQLNIYLVVCKFIFQHHWYPQQSNSKAISTFLPRWLSNVTSEDTPAINMPRQQQQRWIYGWASPTSEKPATTTLQSVKQEKMGVEMRENLVENQKRQNSNFSRGGATITEGARSGSNG